MLRRLRKAKANATNWSVPFPHTAAGAPPDACSQDLDRVPCPSCPYSPPLVVYHNRPSTAPSGSRVYSQFAVLISISAHRVTRNNDPAGDRHSIYYCGGRSVDAGIAASMYCGMRVWSAKRKHHGGAIFVDGASHRKPGTALNVKRLITSQDTPNKEFTFFSYSYLPP